LLSYSKLYPAGSISGTTPEKRIVISRNLTNWNNGFKEMCSILGPNFKMGTGQATSLRKRISL